MLSILEIFEDVKEDSTSADQNGQLTYKIFSRLSKRAELALIDYLSGSVDNQRLPIPWISQKDKDWLSPFIVKLKTQVSEGAITKPKDYYKYDNFARIGSRVVQDCDDEDTATDDCNTIITLLDGDTFNDRCNTYIDELKPSLKKPIAKEIGNTFEVAPKDLGSVQLDYIRYPKFASITGKIDAEFNDEVPDVVVDYEWGEWARPFLIFFITDYFSNKSTSQSIKQFNQSSNPKQ